MQIVIVFTVIFAIGEELRGRQVVAGRLPPGLPARPREVMPDRLRPPPDSLPRTSGIDDILRLSAGALALPIFFLPAW
jgi:hypothetical protein